MKQPVLCTNCQHMPICRYVNEFYKLYENIASLNGLYGEDKKEMFTTVINCLYFLENSMY